MVGQLVNKKLPKYKYDAMERIAETCYKIMNPILGGSVSSMQFLNSSYTLEGAAVRVDLPRGSCLIVVYGGFPRVVEVFGKTVESKENMIPWETAQKVVKAIKELKKNLPQNLGYYERILKCDFTLAYNSLRFWGVQGTRVHYKGVG